jgi:hypothetical protein
MRPRSGGSPVCRSCDCRRCGLAPAQQGTEAPRRECPAVRGSRLRIDENIEISLAISNLGATLARDVQIVFDYPFDSGALPAKEGEERAIDRFTRRLAEGIPSLPPGKKIRTLIDLTNHRGEPGNLRDAYIATATYTSAVTGKTYTDTYRLDIGIYWGRIWVTKKGVHAIYGQLEKIAKEMAKWSPSGGGLLTLDLREVRRRATEIDASYETRTAHGPRKLVAKIRYCLLRRLP